MTGTSLIVLLAVLGVTILRIGQLIWLHLFVGLVLLGPVGVKLASTGYRFLRYYTHNPIYREKGPPQLFLRLIAPAVVATTLTVFATGVLLLDQGPASRGALLLLHKVSFIVWLGFTAVHVLGHLPGMGRELAAARLDGGLRRSSPGAAGRWLALAGAVVGGVVLAVALLPDFAPWTARGVFTHHHRFPARSSEVTRSSSPTGHGPPSRARMRRVSSEVARVQDGLG
jgi:hypothetical protein